MYVFNNFREVTTYTFGGNSVITNDNILNGVTIKPVDPILAINPSTGIVARVFNNLAEALKYTVSIPLEAGHIVAWGSISEEYRIPEGIIEDNLSTAFENITKVIGNTNKTYKTFILVPLDYMVLTITELGRVSKFPMGSINGSINQINLGTVKWDLSSVIKTMKINDTIKFNPITGCHEIERWSIIDSRISGIGMNYTYDERVVNPVLGKIGHFNNFTPRYIYFVSSFGRVKYREIGPFNTYIDYVVTPRTVIGGYTYIDILGMGPGIDQKTKGNFMNYEIKTFPLAYLVYKLFVHLPYEIGGLLTNNSPDDHADIVYIDGNFNNCCYWNINVSEFRDDNTIRWNNTPKPVIGSNVVIDSHNYANDNVAKANLTVGQLVEKCGVKVVDERSQQRRNGLEVFLDTVFSILK